jgi:hypothetical protein
VTDCAWLCSRRQEAALLTRPALPWPSDLVGTRNVPKVFDGLRRVEQGTDGKKAADEVRAPL